MTAQIAFWTGFIGGRFLGAIALLSLVLLFVRNQTRKNIIIAGIIACVIAILINFAGAIDGRLLTLPLAEFLLFLVAVPNVVFFALVTLLTIWRRWNSQKWFAKGMPWVACILCGLTLCFVLPREVKEQFEIQKIAKEMTLKQFFDLPEATQRETVYRIAGMKRENIFEGVKHYQDASDQDSLLRDAVEKSRWFIID